MKAFTFAGRSSKDFGIYLSGSGVFNAPERDVETISIPGRSGDLILDNGRFKNISVPYPCGIVTNFAANVSALRAFLLSQRGYQRLQDDYHPDEFRMAMFAGPIEVEPELVNRVGQFDLIFNCKPQRYLVSGESPTVVSSGGSIANTTFFTALPLITVTGSGSGTLTIQGQVLDLEDMDGSCTIDSEAGHVIGATASGDLPQLQPGENVVTFSGGITAVSIKPRWWTV